MLQLIRGTIYNIVARLKNTFKAGKQSLLKVSRNLAELTLNLRELGLKFQAKNSTHKHLRGKIAMPRSSNLPRISAMALFSSAISLAANAGGLDTEFSDVHLSGGASGGYYAASNEVIRQNDQNRLSDFLLGVDAATKDERVELSAGLGILPGYSLLDHGVDEAGSGAEVQYAELLVHPVEGWTLEVGRMPSNIGFEDTVSFYNAHSMASVQATVQPGYFSATRLSYGNDAFTVYVEQGDEAYEAPSSVELSHSLAAGAMGEISGIEYAVGYQSYVDLRSMVDVVLSTNIAGMDVTLVADQLKLEDAALAAAGDTNHAESVAIYLSGPSFNGIDLPVRVETFNDHGNGLYEGAGKGSSVTVTPTWNLSEHAYLRTDFSFLSMENKILDDKGTPKDSRFMFVLQAGYLI
jgi:hypothetical protein